jgi:hypothetical protein
MKTASDFSFQVMNHSILQIDNGELMIPFSPPWFLCFASGKDWEIVPIDLAVYD